MPNHTSDAHLAELCAAVLVSTRYRTVCPELVEVVGKQELIKRRNVKEAIKATKNKLHQIGGAYLALERVEDATTALATLRAALATGDQDVIRATCRQLMSYHASTRERLPILDEFYPRIFAALGPVQSVLDLACGLNPLALPWMPLPPNSTYHAYDIYQHITDLLDGWLQSTGCTGHARACDILQACPTHEADVALLLKTLPCLEQLEKQCGQRLLTALRTRLLVVSFPVHSLGGRNKGMSDYYEEYFRALVEQTSWHIRHRLEFATELVFLLER